MDGCDAPAKLKRARGRPKKADAPIIDWDTVDALLVFGEKHRNPETGNETVRFPSLADLATRHGVSPNRMWQYSSRHQCMRRREEARIKAQARFEEKMVEKVAEARALATADVIRIVDSYISGFQRAVDEGRVRFDSPADLDRMVRLKELLAGNADSRQELRGGLTLAAIQERHLRLRAQVDALTPATTGEVPANGTDGGGDAVVH